MQLKKHPPFSRTVENFENTDLIICTGSASWTKAKSTTWQPRTAKLVLPFCHDPHSFRWPVAGRYVQVWTCGKPESLDRLLELGRALLNDGAIKVLLLDLNQPMTVLQHGRAA